MTQSTPGGPATDLPDFRPSGNQGVDPALYEIENAAMDREGALWAALQEAAQAVAEECGGLAVPADVTGLHLLLSVENGKARLFSNDLVALGSD